jgi:hypothetical protein
VVVVDGVLRRAIRIGRCLALFAVSLVVFWLALPSAAHAEASGEDAWIFFEAWSSFRNDLDATVPGEHGQVLLIERLEPGPAWLVHDALRLSRSARVIRRLARRVSRGGDGAAIPALRAALAEAPDLESRHAIERALSRLGDTDIQAELTERLRRGSTQERWDAAAALAAAGAKTAPILRTALTDDDAQTRLAAASILAAQQDRRATKLLGELLTSPNLSQRLEAAHALALAGDPRAIAPLSERFDLRGGDRERLARSLGRVGKSPERERLLNAYRVLPRGRSKALRGEILRSIGRITLRLELSEQARQILGDEEDDREEAPGIWLEEIGRALAKGVTSGDQMASAVAESLERALYKETPVAHQHRRAAAGPLVVLLREGELPPLSRVALPEGAEGALRERLATRGGEARERLARFGAALVLLERLGARLGHPALAEPPALRPVGLGAARAVDGSYLTSWIAGEMAGPLRLDLIRPARPRRLLMINGCVDSRASYNDHARVKRVVLRLDGGQSIEGRFADDSPYFQAIDLHGDETSRITLEVAEVYPGRREGAPACVPEIRLDSGFYP